MFQHGCAPDCPQLDVSGLEDRNQELEIVLQGVAPLRSWLFHTPHKPAKWEGVGWHSKQVASRECSRHDSDSLSRWRRGAGPGRSHWRIGTRHVIVSLSHLNSAVVEPGAIEPISGSTVGAASPFFMRECNIKISMIASMKMVNIVHIILIVLIVNSGKTWEEGRIQTCSKEVWWHQRSGQR